MSNRPLITISVPVLNEEANVRNLHTALVKVLESLKKRYDFEIVFTDNASTDSTWDLLTDLSAKDKRVKAYRFTRNIGFQKSILMNYSLASGEAVIQIDADLQDPPELITAFLAEWEKGARVVYGVREVRREGFVNGLVRKMGYWVIDKLSEHPIPRGAGDFRLIDRRVVTTLLAQNNPRPYIRGTIAGMGFRSVGIPYNRSAREHGESKFPLSSVVKLGFSGILDNSLVPLRLASLLGGFFLVASILMIIWTVISRLVDPSLPLGYASLLSVVLLGFGANAMLIGIVSEYLLRVYLTVRADPVGIIADTTVR